MKEIKLPQPRLKSDFPLEKAIFQRRSIRSFSRSPLTMNQISQLLWAGQGITGNAMRVCPSAGATFPLELFLLAGKDGIESFEAGLYHYQPQRHSLKLLFEEDLRSRLAFICWGQNFIAESPTSIIIAAEYRRTTSHYGDRGIRYTHIEVGHVGQNLALQAIALNLGTVVVGAFSDERLSEVLKLPRNLAPLYVIPIGYPK